MLKEIENQNRMNFGKMSNKKSIHVVNMDFASLYPSTMTMKFPSKQSIRKKKIKKIFDL